jgi:hypothetical protein
MKILLLARGKSDVCFSTLFAKIESFDRDPLVKERIEFTSTSSEFIQIRYVSEKETVKSVVSPFGEEREIREMVITDFLIIVRSRRTILVANPPRSIKTVFGVLDRLFPSELITYCPLKLGPIFSASEKSADARLTELKSSFLMVDGGVFKQELIRRREGENSISAHLSASPEQLLSMKIEYSLEPTERYAVEFRSSGSLSISPDPTTEVIFSVLSRFLSDSLESKG